MKAVVIYEPGGPEKLIYTEVPTPKVKPGWSLVEVKGCGINHSEIFTRQGLSPTVTFPRIPGIECVGIIAESTDPERLHKGHKVVSIMGEMGRDFDGGYAEYVLLPNEQIYPIESDLSWDILAAVPETWFTAFGSMLNLKIKEEDTVLVRGATSGVGIAFMKLLKSRYPELKVIGTSRNRKKEIQLKKEGFDEVVVDKDGELQTDASYDKCLELIGPATLKDTFRHIKEGGIVCSSGQLGGQWDLKLEPIMELPMNGYLTSFYSGNVTSEGLVKLFDYIRNYSVDARPKRIFKLKEAAEAHRYLEGQDSFGKVIIRM